MLWYNPGTLGKFAQPIDVEEINRRRQETGPAPHVKRRTQRDLAEEKARRRSAPGGDLYIPPPPPAAPRPAQEKLPAQPMPAAAPITTQPARPTAPAAPGVPAAPPKPWSLGPAVPGQEPAPVAQPTKPMTIRPPWSKPTTQERAEEGRPPGMEEFLRNR